MNPTDLDIREFRQALGSFLTGVTVVTTLNDRSEPVGFTANSFTSVSLDPPLVLVCLAKSSYNCNSFARGSHYAINILSEDQREVSVTFASPVRERFAEIDWHSGPTGSPIINQVAAWLDCTMHEVVDAGDHMIFIGQVVAFDSFSATPLGYLRGNYVRFALEQEAVVAMENPDKQTSVGAIVEHEGRIFLSRNPAGGMQLPIAPRLGNELDQQSLLGQLARMGLKAKVTYLFAVFENNNDKTLSIYYRGQVTDYINTDQGRFYDLADIPFERIADPALCTMLKRYIRERAQDAFGIYVGDERDGAVESISTGRKNGGAP